MALFCEATGKPSPTITWTSVLEDGSNGEVLHQGPTWNFSNISKLPPGPTAVQLSTDLKMQLAKYLK